VKQPPSPSAALQQPAPGSSPSPPSLPSQLGAAPAPGGGCCRAAGPGAAAGPRAAAPCWLPVPPATRRRAGLPRPAAPRNPPGVGRTATAPSCRREGAPRSHLRGEGAARPAASQAPQPCGGPLTRTKGRFPPPPQHPPPVTGGAAPLTSARRLPPLRRLHSAAAKPNNIPYSGFGAPTAPARPGGRGQPRPFPRGAPRET